mmetsp:Transcript_23662/g.30686  ORF Transcript_23662/g.30686 Transcript_23662/m.30686 type:complete len:127 (+) Transcript_23662:198-578(+)
MRQARKKQVLFAEPLTCVHPIESLKQFNEKSILWWSKKDYKRFKREILYLILARNNRSINDESCVPSESETNDKENLLSNDRSVPIKFQSSSISSMKKRRDIVSNRLPFKKRMKFDISATSQVELS